MLHLFSFLCLVVTLFDLIDLLSLVSTDTLRCAGGDATVDFDAGRREQQGVDCEGRRHRYSGGGHKGAYRHWWRVEASEFVRH